MQEEVAETLETVRDTCATGLALAYELPALRLHVPCSALCGPRLPKLAQLST